MKTIKDIIELYKPKSADEDRFVKKHVIKKTEDANGNKDDVFNATNVNSVDRTPKHGYNPGEDEKVYEETEKPNRLAIIAAAAKKKKAQIGKTIVTGSKGGVGGAETRRYPAGTLKNSYEPEGEELDEAKRKLSPIEKLYNRPSMQFAKKYTDQKKVQRHLGIPYPRHLPKEGSDTGTTSSLEGSAKQKEIENVAKRTMQNNSYDSENALVLNPFLRGLLEATCKECGEKYKGKTCPCCMKEDVQIDEILEPSMGAAAYIDDFVHSKNPKFDGLSKEKRKQMALAAYYAAKKGK